jgi:CheY-like chemotaxis protein
LLQNLVSNAVKYTPSGRVLVGARRRNGRLVVEVWDTGLGIPTAKQKVVFREFQRLDQGAKVARGLGLGLSIVERIGRVLEHAVTLKSQPGRGSVFRVEVPIVVGQTASVTPLEKPRAPATPLSGLRVLVLDNEPAILEGMRTLLSGWGCEVLTAGDQEAALAHLKERTPEAILADYHLDDGNGLDAIGTLRAAAGRDLPAVLLTADRTLTLREAAAGQGVHVLNKPVKPAGLRALLVQWRASRVAAE